MVAGARTACGAEVIVLRLLDVEGDTEVAGGHVTYLAELHGPVPPGVRPWAGHALVDDPRRARWARPGGPADDLAWATETLDSLGRRRTGPAVQRRTWNLSSLWTIPTDAGDVWLKAVPPFLAHEGRVLDAMQDRSVPRLLAFDHEGRVLLEHVAGENQFHAGLDRLRAMVALLVELQAAWMGREADLLALGMPDWRRGTFLEAAADTVASASEAVAPAVMSALDALVDSLEDRFDAVAACGVPDTLVHGDFHPGNFRSDGRSLVLLDWGDSGVGHPLLDMSSFLDMTPPEHHRRLEAVSADAWALAVPGSDPRRAATLLAPLSALRRAVVYRRFLRGIERSEQRYHDRDVLRWLERATH